ncbi:fimbrial chaperone protein [Dyella sp. M7H15-1]|uniref:fimbria/pilus chaperone family protein n=1 Tax=Dyella sp. M7H15-1 TaxID=2501295 RepID=UPI00100520FE|nr:fimbria/pilus chaperone family protein [Dyella sp. M7H15-1]QAU23647.1 fimbrial chaperone protein [Dyella sp. M7H15-1]
MTRTIRPSLKIIVAAIFASGSLAAHADGMLPATTVVLVNEADKEASMQVRNDDPVAALLYVSLEDIPEDKEPLLIVTPPVTRVEPGASQTVRFILQNREPLKTERLKRATFEGIQPKDPNAKAKLAVTVRQNLPVIIHPKGLPLNKEPWKLLTWSASKDSLTVRNDSPYVVRIAQDLVLQPGNASAELPNPYVLPGQVISVPIKGTATAVEFTPASLYGFALPKHQAPVTAGQ